MTLEQPPLQRYDIEQHGDAVFMAPLLDGDYVLYDDHATRIESQANRIAALEAALRGLVRVHNEDVPLGARGMAWDAARNLLAGSTP